MSSERERGNLIVISAPSGAGKTSLASRVLKDEGLFRLRFSISHTTRRPRAGESHGVEYFFVSVPEFQEMRERGAFLEDALVHGNHYATSRDFVFQQLAQGRDVLLDIDIQGAQKVKRQLPDALMIFVFPPSFQELEGRLRKRGLDDEEEIRRRLRIAYRESSSYSDYDYVIINDDLEKSVLELKSILLAARCRRDANRSRAEAILATFPARRFEARSAKVELGSDEAERQHELRPLPEKEP